MGDCFSHDGSEVWVTFKFYTSVASNPCFEYYKPISSNYYQMKRIVFNGFERYIYNRFQRQHLESKKNIQSSNSAATTAATLTTSLNTNDSAPFATGRTGPNQAQTVQTLQITSKAAGGGSDILAKLNNNDSTLVALSAADSVASNVSEQNRQNEENHLRRSRYKYRCLKRMFAKARQNDIFIDKFITLEYKILKLHHEYEDPIEIQSSQHWDFVRKKEDLQFYVQIDCQLLERHNYIGAYVLAELINDFEYLEAHPRPPMNMEDILDERDEKNEMDDGSNGLRNKNVSDKKKETHWHKIASEWDERKVLESSDDDDDIDLKFSTPDMETIRENTIATGSQAIEEEEETPKARQNVDTKVKYGNERESRDKFGKLRISVRHNKTPFNRPLNDMNKNLDSPQAPILDNDASEQI